MIDLRKGDCLKTLKDMEDNSVDLILTDPPYEIAFMGKGWDNTGIAFSEELWKEALRVLKPGGYLMAFSATRTYHKMACSIEDAGFSIKDFISYTYGSGFPKALDISKAIDKKAGVEREVIGSKFASWGDPDRPNYGSNNRKGGQGIGFKSGKINITAPKTELAKQYEGYKSPSLKPAHEPICLAQKPLSEKNYAENVIKWGTGGLNIDKARIGTEKISIHNAPKGTFAGGEEGRGSDTTSYRENIGRFPANFVISEDIAPLLDSQSGISKSSRSEMAGGFGAGDIYGEGKIQSVRGHNDEGGASRFFYNAKIEEGDYTPFFYTAKASKKERNSNKDGEVVLNNNHATVKPISIMKYLATLGLPPYDSVILDLFAGSGTTGLAIEKINKETGSHHTCILCEREDEYIKIIEKRLCLEEKEEEEVGV